jgi:hypothetical protein
MRVSHGASRRLLRVSRALGHEGPVRPWPDRIRAPGHERGRTHLARTRRVRVWEGGEGAALKGGSRRGQRWRGGTHLASLVIEAHSPRTRLDHDSRWTSTAATRRSTHQAGHQHSRVSCRPDHHSRAAPCADLVRRAAALVHGRRPGVSYSPAWRPGTSLAAVTRAGRHLLGRLDVVVDHGRAGQPLLRSLHPHRHPAARDTRPPPSQSL